jgi:Flp pilus assembly pilin Flp
LKKLVNRFRLEESGQDMVEYALLLAFVCMAAAGLASGTGLSVSGIWSTLSSVLTSVTAAS